ncbi:hypothetical protein ACFO1B_23155 [Dactylosporangium siamense]|uniref:Uncharacterized protein n=1 Tax=Dactylosporangium siamense TaxID=685454 RepID=A0A919U905_9ACTN|nr:hypothetical protein [Dactylosporangium siamense]GIG47094.1 hypothetical protein Dsi01nite_051350 [Dactylosporangium siamense]
MRSSHVHIHVQVDRVVLGRAASTGSLELFFAEIAPVIRRELTSRPLERSVPAAG